MSFGARVTTLPRWRAAVRVAAPLALAWSCAVPGLDLERRPCPCAEGYTCDAATDTCVASDTSASTSTASGPTSGVTTTATTTASHSTGEGAGPSGPGGGGSTGDGGGSTGGGGTASSSASTGEGGGSPCGDLLPSVPACGGFVSTFDSQAMFGADWNTSGAPTTSFIVAGGTFTIRLINDGPAFAFSEPELDFADCAIWTRLVRVSDDAGVMTRLSVGAPGEASRYSIGPLGTDLTILDADLPIATLPYDEASMRWLRIRADGVNLHFGTSSEGQCWMEHHQVVDSLVGVTARLVMLRYAGSVAEVESTFDDFGAPP